MRFFSLLKKKLIGKVTLFKAALLFISIKMLKLKRVLQDLLLIILKPSPLVYMLKS